MLSISRYEKTASARLHPDALVRSTTPVSITNQYSYQGNHAVMPCNIVDNKSVLVTQIYMYTVDETL